MRKPLLIAGVGLSVVLLNVLNLTPLLSPLLYTMTPLQRYYAAAYLASSWHRDDPAATTETRTIWKARPDKFAKDKTGKSKTGKDKIEKEEFELATEQDLVALPAGKLIGRFSTEPFQLSEAAFAAGCEVAPQQPIGGDVSSFLPLQSSAAFRLVLGRLTQAVKMPQITCGSP